MPEQDNMQEQSQEAQQQQTSQEGAHEETHDKRFKSQEEAERAYAELSKKLGQQGSELGELRKKLDTVVDPEEFTAIKSQLEEMKTREWAAQAASAVGGGDNLQALNEFLTEKYTDEAERNEIIAACRHPKTGMATLRGLAAEAGLGPQSSKESSKGPIKGAPTAGTTQKQQKGFENAQDMVKAAKNARRNPDAFWAQVAASSF
jgi:hypothetical protein